MDYLQYNKKGIRGVSYDKKSFKPCYKWITFNTCFINIQERLIFLEF